MINEKVIEIKNLSKSYKDFKAVNDLSLTVFKGDIFGFLGPNGAGKSTTIRILLSLIKPTSGIVRIFGKSINESRFEILTRIGAIVEKPDFYLFLSAYKNLEILSSISGIQVTKKQIMEILELVGLEKRANSNVKTFSFGMKQRLGLAQALIHDPELIILDEPTIGLDPKGMKEIRELIIYLSKEKGKTIFLSSHILSEVEIIATRLAIVNYGTTIIEGNISEFIKPENQKVRFLLSSINFVHEVLENSVWKSKITNFSESEIIFNLKYSEISELNKYLVNNNVSVNAIIPVNSLEEYFLDITSAKR